MHVFILWKKKTKHSLINIGTGKDHSIKFYVNKILKILDVKLKISYDKKKPNGTPRKLLDNSLAKKYGWRPKISLDQGIKLSYKSFLKKLGNS